MSFVLQPWQLLLAILADWINRQQQKVIEYLRTENQVLKEAHGKQRIRLTDDQRRRLAVKGEVLGRKVLGEIVCPSRISGPVAQIEIMGSSSPPPTCGVACGTTAWLGPGLH